MAARELLRFSKIDPDLIDKKSENPNMLHTHFTTCGERSEEQQFLVNSKQWIENLVDHPVFKAGKYMTHI